MDYKPLFKETAERLVKCAAKNPDSTWQTGWLHPLDIMMCVHLPTKAFDPIEPAEHIIKSMGVDIAHFGFEAGYSPDDDNIRMPQRKWFKSADTFYSTALHELGHATGHQSRLDRETLTNYHERDNECVEEMVAEFTAAFVLNTLGLNDDDRNSAYIFHWTKQCADPKVAFLSAAINAGKAAQYILDKAS